MTDTLDTRETEGVNRVSAWLARLPASVLLVAVIVGFAYANSLAGEFVWDDRSLIEDNPALDGFGSIGAFFTQSFEESTGPGAEVATYYRPVVLLSFLLDKATWGLRPVGFHFTNLVLHAICSVLVLLILRALVDPRAALVGALLFAVHPVHTESVTWISGRTDLLASVFLLAALLFYGRARRDPGLGRWFVASFGFFFVALFCKELSYVFPLVIFALEGFDRRPGAAVRLFPFFAGLLLFGIFYAGVVGINPLALGDVDGFAVPEFGYRLLTATKLVIVYVGKLVFPVRLNAEWEPGWIESFATPWLLGAVAILFALFAAYRARAKDPHWLGLLLWFGLFLLPVLNLLPIKEVAAERFLYLPSAAFAGVGAKLVARGSRVRFGRVMVCLILSFFFLRTIDRNREWRDGLTLFEVTAAETTSQPRAQYNLAKELQIQGFRALGRGQNDQGRELLGKALTRYREVLALGHHAVVVYLALAEIHLALGETREALNVYSEGIVVHPDVVDVRFAEADLLFQLGDDEEARRRVEEILARFPDFPEARRILGILDYRRGDFVRAERELLRSLKGLPQRADLFHVLGVIYSQQRRLPEAIEAFQSALDLDPFDLTSMGNLAKLWTFSPPGPYRRPKEALILIERALRYEERPEFVRTFLHALVADQQLDRAHELVTDLLATDPSDRSELERISVELRRLRGL